VASPPVQLEDGHVPCGADHEERQENNGDWQVDPLLDAAAEGPCCGDIWRVFIHLHVVREEICGERK
jgi:hypothetical protein